MGLLSKETHRIPLAYCVLCNLKEVKAQKQKSPFRGCLKMPRCKASEIPRNEAYIEVRRSDEG